MAKANTFEMEKGGFIFDTTKNCIICGKKPEYRGFYYPTYFNGDAEWLGDYCKEHRNTNLKDVMDGKVKLLYKIEE